VSSFSFFECFALTADTVGFFGVWIGMRAVAAVSSMQRLRMAANANLIAEHVTLLPSVYAYAISVALLVLSTTGHRALGSGLL
jgi:hypothetical protein